MDPAMVEAMKNMTPEQAKELMANMTPEQRAQMERMQKGMADLAHLTEKLAPSETDPDVSVSLLRVIQALATSPIMSRLGEACDEEVLKKLEDGLVAAEQLEANAVASCSALERRNVLLLFWHMNQSNLTELAAAVTPEVNHLRGGANELATQLLIKAQMLMPQRRWVQPTLAVARASALISNALWSHTDPKALAAMRTILEEDQLPYPKLTMEADAGSKASDGVDKECLTSQPVLVTLKVHRGHAAKPEEGPRPPPNNAQGIYEAYWLYIEGLKPQGTPNSLIAAQPLVVKDLEMKAIEAKVPFTAPPKAGTYTLRVHVCSTSVVGIAMSTDVAFTVTEDDVPALE